MDEFCDPNISQCFDPKDTQYLPAPDVYEKEYIYWPWGKLIKIAVQWLSSNAPHSAFILDYMCGTGWLLNELSLLRSDLIVEGCSLTRPFVEYARKKYPHIKVVMQDAMNYQPPMPPDIIVCSAGLHHLERTLQQKFIDKVASELSQDKYFLLGEELINDFKSERERQLAVLEMVSALLLYVVKNDAPRDVAEAAANLVINDLFEKGEYKTCYREIIEMLEPSFFIDSVHHTWPDDQSHFGDFLFICRRK